MIFLEKQDKPVECINTIVFPYRVQLAPDKNVYISEVSPIYRYGINKKASEDANFTRLEKLYNSARTYFMTKS